MWITPNHQDSDFTYPLSLDDKITIFLASVYGWQLDIADKCINTQEDQNGNIVSRPIKHSGFAVLHIVLSYFEMIAKFQDGFAAMGRSKHFFKQGVLSVFPTLRNHPIDIVDRLINLLYEGGRCGLYHSGATNPHIILTKDIDAPLAFADSPEPKLVINPHLLVPALKMHLAEYGKQLRDSTKKLLRGNFERRFDFQATQA